MPSRKDYDELDKIVRQQKPGFTIDRRARPGRTRADKSTRTQGTPDVDDLKAKAENLLRFKKRTRRGSASRKDRPDASRAAEAGDMRIVSVHPDHPIDRADRPSRSKKVIISRSTGRIIGEQG
jgi:hypothetical protein